MLSLKPIKKTKVKIYYIAAIQRKKNTLNEIEIIAKYPFPEVECEGLEISLQQFLSKINTIKNKLDKDRNLKRIGFIFDIWHQNNMLKVIVDDWTIIY